MGAVYPSMAISGGRLLEGRKAILQFLLIAGLG